MKNIWIIAEAVDSVAAMVAGAKSLASDSAITVFVRGDENVAQPAYQYGVNQVYALPLSENALWEEDYLPELVKKAKEEQPQLVLLGTSKRCRDMAARMAALLDAPCISDAKNLAVDGGVISGEMMVYGGLAVKSVKTQAPIVLATVSAQNYEVLPADSSQSGTVIKLAAQTGSSRVVERQPRKAQTSNLGDALKVVGVGRGVSEQSDLAIAERLAKKVEGEIACTRPIAEFFKWLPEEVYVGVSGQVIKPQLYIAVGISGQAQHYYGIRDAKVIVSINKDPDALMNANSDYYIVGDFKEVLPALEAALA
ncbi:MAG: electron transfer flavoprotein subunit alpha/FixB family protein [Enterobacteriaceae bacterium]|jgi:electron transfer flavoprotein alpha subunit|nr:electron transfer flavoprotein subunit alpha/FixB family protein [Enterobacteriaceae bacterium]